MRINTKDMRAKIMRAVAREPKAADDDKLLISLIWENEGWDYMLSVYENLRRVSSPETIRRTRQKLVEEGKIEPSAEATEARYQEFKRIATDCRGNVIMF